MLQKIFALVLGDTHHSSLRHKYRFCACHSKNPDQSSSSSKCNSNNGPCDVTSGGCNNRLCNTCSKLADVRNKNWKHGKHCPNRIHISNKNVSDQKENRESSENIVSKPCNIDQRILQEQKEKMEKWIKENVSNKSQDIERQNTNKVSARKGSGPAQHTISKIGRTYVKGNASILYNMALKRGNVTSDTDSSDSEKPPLKMTKPRHKRLDRIALHNSAKFTRKIQSSSDPEIKDSEIEKNPIVHVGKYNRAVQRQNVLPKIGYNFNNTVGVKNSQKLSDILGVLDKSGGPKVRISIDKIDEMFDGYASTDSESSDASTLCESDSEPESVIQKEDRKMGPQSKIPSNFEQNEEKHQCSKRERLPSICLESTSGMKVLFEGTGDNIIQDISGTPPNNENLTTKETVMDQTSGSETRSHTDLVGDGMRTSSNPDVIQAISIGADPSETGIIQNVNSGSHKNDEKESGISGDGSQTNLISQAENKSHMDNGSCSGHQSFQNQEILKEKPGSKVDCKKSIQSPEGVFQNRKQDQDCTLAGQNNGVGTRTGVCDSNPDHKSNPDFSQEGEMTNGLTCGSLVTIKGVHVMTQDITKGAKNDPMEDCALGAQQSPGSNVCKREIAHEHKSAFDCDESNKINADMNSKLENNHKANEPNDYGGGGWAIEQEFDKLEQCHRHGEQLYCNNNKIKALTTGKFSAYNDAIISQVDMDIKIMQCKYNVDKAGCEAGNECIGNSNGGVLEIDPTTHALVGGQNACIAHKNGPTEAHKYFMSDVKSDYFDSQSIGNQYLSYTQHDNDHEGDSHSINGVNMSGVNACSGKYFPNTASLGAETHSSKSNRAVHKSTADICECSHESDLICDKGVHYGCNACRNDGAIVGNPGVCQKGQEAIKAGNQGKINNKSEEDMKENIDHDKSMSGKKNPNHQIIKNISIDNNGLGGGDGAGADMSNGRLNERELKGSCTNLEYVELGEDNSNSSQSDLCHNGAQSGATLTAGNDGRDNRGLGVMVEVQVITNSDSGKLVDQSGNGNSAKEDMMYGTLGPERQWDHVKCEENGTLIGDHQVSVTPVSDPNSGGEAKEFQHVMEENVEPPANLTNNKNVKMRHEGTKMQSKCDRVSCGSLKMEKVGLEGASNMSSVVTTKAKSATDGSHSLLNTIASKIDESITCEPHLMAGQVDVHNMPNYVEPTSGFETGTGLGCPRTNDSECYQPNVQLIPSDILKDKMDVQIDGSPTADEPVLGPETFDGTRVTTGGEMKGQMACHQSTGNEAQEALVIASGLHDKFTSKSTFQSPIPEGRSIFRYRMLLLAVFSLNGCFCYKVKLLK